MTEEETSATLSLCFNKEHASLTLVIAKEERLTRAVLNFEQARELAIEILRVTQK